MFFNHWAWVKELRDQLVVATQYVDSEENLADILTKGMPGPKFAKMKQKIVDFKGTPSLEGLK